MKGPKKASAPADRQPDRHSESRPPLNTPDRTQTASSSDQLEISIEGGTTGHTHIAARNLCRILDIKAQLRSQSSAE